MGLTLYVITALCLVLLVGWLLYVAPTPGPLSPGDLLVALLPAFSIVGAVLLVLGAGWIIFRALRMVSRIIRRLQHRAAARASPPPAPKSRDAS